VYFYPRRGALADSTALIGFGIDSLIESSSGVVLLWRLHGGERGEARERRALRLVGLSFLTLAAYVTCDATWALVAKAPSEVSWTGIVLAMISLIVMPVLSARERRLAASPEAVRCTRIPAKPASVPPYLPFCLVGCRSMPSCDPMAALIMTPIIIREGLEALKRQVCSDCQP
jgi:hypothetical protein